MSSVKAFRLLFAQCSSKNGRTSEKDEKLKRGSKSFESKNGMVNDLEDWILLWKMLEPYNEIVARIVVVIPFSVIQNALNFELAGLHVR